MTHIHWESLQLDLSSLQYDKINAIISKKPFASKSDSKNYGNMFHGFAAARAGTSETILFVFSNRSHMVADLENKENKKE